MLYLPPAGPAPVFPLPSGGRPFLPVPPPLVPPQLPPGTFFPGPPLNFPYPLSPPVLPGLHNAGLLHQLGCRLGGPVNWNFQPPRTPHTHFRGQSQQQRPYWKTRNNKQQWKAANRASPGTNPQSGSGSKPAPFVCVPCHKEYKSQQTYDVHMATHIKCSHCGFECSKGTMHEHELIHYLPAELKFTSQEEIEKWREERRKNFPTVETVLRKKQLQEEREKRGDVIRDTPLYRYVSRVCGSDDRRCVYKGRGRRHNHWVVGSNRRYTEGVRRGGEGGKRDEVSRQPWVKGQRGRGGRGGGRGRGGRRGRNSGPRHKGSDVRGQQGLNYVSARKPTLLEKLLAKEIQVEQNTILQCVRYAVRNNFFGVGGGVTDTGVRGQEEVRGQEGDQKGSI